ncbi:MAG: toprim domain-containing protein, partial [Planctomycetes bacterium]|nr:toprim domain-containing protein [Planctomycetota bacterium]
TAHQHGFRNVIASMGTALTENQIAILKTLTTHICLSLDADAAGNAATLRGIEICRNTFTEEIQETKDKKYLGGYTRLGTNISIIKLPDGKDPDEMIRENSNQWIDIVDKARPLADHIFDLLTEQVDSLSTEARSQLVDELITFIAEMQDEATRESYVSKLSRITALTENAIAAKIAPRLSVKKGKIKLIHSAKENRKHMTTTLTTATHRTGDQLEEHCLSLLLQYQGLRNMTKNLSADCFERSENREIFDTLCIAQGNDDIREKLDATLHEHLQAL